MTDPVPVATLEQIPPGRSLVVRLEGVPVAIFNVGGTLHAISHTCPHSGGPLADGTVQGKVVECPYHFWTFDLTTGESPVNPEAKVDVYGVRVEDGKVYLTAPS